MANEELTRRRERNMETTKGHQEANMDMQAMMDVYKKLGTTGAPHKMLASMVGSWKTKVKSWCDPNTGPMESTGTSEHKMLLGGRFLQQEFNRRNDGESV
jgi:hypothetical protein